MVADALIVLYYQGEKGEKIKNRKGLMQVFGVPAGTLRMRALRLRDGFTSALKTVCSGKVELHSDKFLDSDSLI
jgi:hypothetical protein